MRALIVLALPFAAFAWLGQHAAGAFLRDCGDPRLLEAAAPGDTCWSSPANAALAGLGLLLLLAVIGAVLFGPALRRPSGGESRRD